MTVSLNRISDSTLHGKHARSATYFGYLWRQRSSSPSSRQVSLALLRNNTLIRLLSGQSEPTGCGRRTLNLIDDKKYCELEQRAKQLKDEETMVEFLFLMREAYDLQHVFFSVLDKTASGFTKVYGTYPEEWRTYYSENNLAEADPVLKRSCSQTPLLWDAIESMTEEEASLMQARVAHGIGPHGMTIPLISSDGRLSLLSITGKTDSCETWRRRSSVLVREFRDIGMTMHAAFLRLNGHQPPRVELSTRHIDCIRLIGHGMSIEELASFQGLSQRSAKQYLSEARKRLRARNNAQLIYNAIQLGFIEM